MRLSVSQRESLQEAAERYYRSVAEVAPYLQGRGITGEVARTFRLGYVAEPVLGDEEYLGRLSIPYITLSGVIDIRYRAVTPDQTPKYKSRPGTTTHLYNVAALVEESDILAVCEGEFDTIVTHGLCGIPAVGVPGANNWKDHFPLLLSDYARVFVLCDGDEAGRGFGKKVASLVEGTTVVTMPEGADVNDVYLAEGPDGIRKRVGL